MYKIHSEQEVKLAQSFFWENLFMENENKKFKIIKKVAKHGSQAIIVIPRAIEQHLKPGTITEVNIEVIRNIE